jgi:hypothetical protein
MPQRPFIGRFFYMTTFCFGVLMVDYSMPLWLGSSVTVSTELPRSLLIEIFIKHSSTFYDARQLLFYKFTLVPGNDPDELLMLSPSSCKQGFRLWVFGTLHPLIELLTPGTVSEDAGIESWQHKVHIFIEYRSVYPLVGIGTPPPPLM